MQRVFILSVFAALVILAAPTTAQAQNITTVQVASGLNDPLWVGSPPGEYRYLYIAEQPGRIRLFDMTTGTLMPGDFHNLTGPVNPLFNEQGLLGVAFHPDFATNGFYYVHYTNNGQNSIVRRYSTDPANPIAVTPNSSQTIMQIPQPDWNHNGGMIAFKPGETQRNLYIGVGDGGGGGDTYNTSQNLNSMLAKILRIDVDGTSPGNQYGIPADNPGPAGLITTTVPETWMYGLRNPWRFCFDTNGDMYIGDVGQGAWEEIDFVPNNFPPAGFNFGWRCREGAHCFGTFAGACTCTTPSLEDPIWEYANAGAECSITGGEVYRGLAIPALDGTYFYADYCSDKIWSFEYNGTTVSGQQERTAQLDPPGFQSIDSITSFGKDAYGEIYICDRGGELYKIVRGNMTDCNNNDIHDPTEVTVGMEDDCDMNGVLDSCDIAAGAADANMNGILDICEAGVEFIRGDCNTDASFNIADAISKLDYLFNMGLTTCFDACDSNDDGGLDISDPIYSLAALFSMGPLPASPHPLCGLDPTSDSLDCVTGPTCP